MQHRVHIAIVGRDEWEAAARRSASRGEGSRQRAGASFLHLRDALRAVRWSDVFARTGWSVIVAILAVGCANALAPPSPSSSAPPSQPPYAATPAGTAPSAPANESASASPNDGYTGPSTPVGSGNTADAACSAFLDNIPAVRVESGKATLAAAFEVTGAQLTSYFVTTLNADPNHTNGSDWWGQPTKLVDLCLYDGDFTTVTPGPAGNDTSAARVLVVISDGEAEFWARTLNKSALPATDPATISSQCPNQTWPPYDAPDPVPGISVTAKDKGHTLITNASDETYYYEVSRWPTDQLVCGLGQHEQGLQSGPIAGGSTVEIGEGSTPDIPVTIEIWDAPCGEGCDRPPIGAYVVPVSTIEPVPVST